MATWRSLRSSSRMRFIRIAAEGVFQAIAKQQFMTKDFLFAIEMGCRAT